MQRIWMYPDFGDECFWYSPSGIVCPIEEFEPLLPSTSKLHQDIKKWRYSFNKQEEEQFSWSEFNQQGRKLHKELEKLLNNKYLIEYVKSYEEQQND